MRKQRGQSRSTELPSGTVTFLLTDVEASSSSWISDADETDNLLRDLDELLRAAIEPKGGSLIKSRGEGDSAFTVFERASSAVMAACVLQQSLAARIGLSVRGAIHTGEVRLRDGDYYGLAPNRTARLRALAHGGQILVSRLSAELAEPELPDDVSLTTLGVYRVKDWPRAVHIYGIRAPGLRSDFPPLRVLGDAERALMTVVCIDMVGSTEKTASMTDPQLADVHRALYGVMRAAFDTHRGTFLKLLGDGCLALFEDPLSGLGFVRSVMGGTGDAVKAAMDIGMLELVDEDAIGRAIYEVFGLMRHAGPGELLATQTVADLLGGHGLRFHALPMGVVQDSTKQAVRIESD